MTYLARLRLKNVEIFGGEHELQFGPKSYALVAQHEEDEGKSNALGKSAIVEAVRLVFYGEHRHRLEDGWITDGEAVGEVEAVLSDGSRFLRSRHRGKPTRFYAMAPGVSMEKAALQAEGQRIVLERLGLSKEDFAATCFFEQKKMSRLVTATPEERMTIVSGWLDLGSLVRAEEIARARLAKVADEASGYAAKMRSLLEERDRLLGREAQAATALVDEAAPPQVVDVVARLQERGKLATEEAAAADAVIAEAHAQLREVRQALGFVADAQKHGEVVEEGHGLVKARAAIALLSEEEQARIEKKNAAAGAQVTKLSLEAHQLKPIAQGAFDGKCPIIPMECPAKAKINARKDEAADRLRKCKAEMTPKMEEAEELQDQLAADRKARAAAADLDVRIERLRERARALGKAKKAVAGKNAEQLEEEAEDAEARLITAKRERDEAIRRATNTASVLERVASIAVEIEALSKAAAEVDKALVTHREAMLILGRNGAQRSVAEGTIKAFEDGANGALAQAEIGMQIAVKWAREGKGLAKACDGCGQPFPTSEKVRSCTRCGTERGPHLINRLDVDVVPRSGGMEDLAGIYLQLAASAWLRSAKGCSWATAVLDEPMGALDKSARRALGQHIVQMIRGFSFEQAFLIAHSSDVLDALPGRVQITSTRSGSALRSKVEVFG